MILNTLVDRQLHSDHHVTAILLLFLTATPFLFYSHLTVSAFSNDELALNHQFIEKFDIIQDEDLSWSRSIRTRQVHPSAQLDKKSHAGDQTDVTEEIETEILNKASVKKGHFSSLGRRFNLILDRRSIHLVTPDFTITTIDADGREKTIPYIQDDIRIMGGYIDGEKDSEATVAFSHENKVSTAQIKIGHDIYMIERAYLHKNSLIYNPQGQIDETYPNGSSNLSPKFYENTLIVYNLSDHKQFKEDNNETYPNFANNLGDLCSSLNMSDYNQGNASTRYENTADTSKSDLDFVYKIYKKPSKKKLSRRGIEYITESAREKTRCTLHLVADYLFYKNVGNGDIQTTINYILALINRVNQIYLPIVWDTGVDGVDKISNIGFTVQNITVHQEYTRLTSDQVHYNMQTDKLWNAREFLDNFSRYSPPRHYCLAHLLTYRQFDTAALGLAYVASSRFGTIGGICSPMQQKGDSFYKHNTGISTSRGISGETLITRQAELVVAHEFGHNMGAEHDSNECRPSPSKGGSYLMHPFAVMGFEKNNRYMSECSKAAIGRVIRRKGPSCFVGVVDHACGNGIVEDGEECDGGDLGHGHNDPCCDSSCRLISGYTCSDRNSWCCSMCRMLPAGNPCRAAEEYNCKQTSYCNGSSAECPPSPPAEDNKVCVGRGLCRDGECTPFCEAHDMISCLCSNPADACRLCCKTSPNGTCFPYDSKAPYLPDGLLCYRGVCEKGRCEQPIQDFIERLWDVVEDVSFTTVVKFLRDNIIIVVLAISIPLWCIFSHLINEFDRRVKHDLMNAIMRARQRKSVSHSPFLPTLFVGDDITSNRTRDSVL